MEKDGLTCGFQSRLQLYINAVRTIDLRGCLPAAINLDGFPHLFAIFPCATRIISDTQELVRHSHGNIGFSGSSFEPSYTLTTTLRLCVAEYADPIALPPHNLPVTWNVVRYVAISGGYSYWGHPPYWEEEVPCALQLARISHLEVMKFGLECDKELFRALATRVLNGLAPIDSLAFNQEGLSTSDIVRIATCQNTGPGTGTACVKQLVISGTSVSTEQQLSLPGLGRLKWESLRGLEHLELDVVSDCLGDNQSESWLEQRKENEPESSSYYELAPWSFSASILDEHGRSHVLVPLDLASCTLNLEVDELCVDTSTAQNVARALPPASDLAVLLLSIGGYHCIYALRPKRYVDEELIDMTEFFCATVMREIGRLVIQHNQSGSKGWRRIGKAGRRVAGSGVHEAMIV
jgi:hypothetical protein